MPERHPLPGLSPWKRLLERDAFGCTLRAGDAVGDAGRDLRTGRVASGSLRLLASSSGSRGASRLSAKFHADFAAELV
jgi:hypothetical protein